ncbi:peptide methionine sulfoxide reductase [Paenibacillus thiaminolyticus]|uniref:peptide methionine sulfoxide reductase n=1 Tax=Paenibacillus thiaminolyticus TaxID=49283 RepID=UPI003D2DB542
MSKREWAGRLLSAMDGRVSRRVDTLNVIDLGTIQDDGSLLLDQFAVPIPAEGYLLADWDFTLPVYSRVARLASPVVETGEDTAETTYSALTRFDFVTGEDGSRLADVSPRFVTGDRVLVLWVSGEPIIMSKVVSGDHA